MKKSFNAAIGCNAKTLAIKQLLQCFNYCNVSTEIQD